MTGVDGNTTTCILIGNPVGHSLSPAIHNNSFKEIGLNWVYITCQVDHENLRYAIDGMRGLNIKGANVTIPYKEKVIPYLDEITPEAKLMGAVNTIVNQNGFLVGHNTDGAGFVRSLLELDFDPAEKKLAVLGTGGAAKGITVALAKHQPMEIILIYRSVEKARELQGTLTNCFRGTVSTIGLNNKAEINQTLEKVQLLVHTTPVGMHPKVAQKPLVNLSENHSHLLVADLIYNPLETLLLKKAKELGCTTLSGLGMFVYQGALAFELWTGHSAPVEVMKQTVLAKMKLTK